MDFTGEPDGDRGGRRGRLVVFALLTAVATGAVSWVLLRRPVKGGRSYNFTGDSADALLTFQRAVEAARKRLMIAR